MEDDPAMQDALDARRLTKGALGSNDEVMSTAKKPKVLRLRFPVPSTFDRVESAAKLFRALLNAGGAAHDADVTMAVANRKMENHVRAWNPIAEVALDQVIAVVGEDFDRGVHHKVVEAVARAFQEHAIGLTDQGGEFLLYGKTKPFARLNWPFVKRLSSLLPTPETVVSRHTTTLYGRVVGVAAKRNSMTLFSVALDHVDGRRVRLDADVDMAMAANAHFLQQVRLRAMVTWDGSVVLKQEILSISPWEDRDLLAHLDATHDQLQADGVVVDVDSWIRDLSK